MKTTQTLLYGELKVYSIFSKVFAEFEAESQGFNLFVIPFNTYGWNLSLTISSPTLVKEQKKTHHKFFIL